MSTTAPIRLHRPTVGEEEALALQEVLESGQFVQGPRVAAFEAALTRVIETPHAMACASGTAALHLVALALRLQPGDEVIVPDYTFPATAAAFVRVGAVPVLVDVEPETANLTVRGVERAVTSRTRAVIAVHQFGLPCDLPGLVGLCQDRGIHLVEDAACALGATVMDGKKPRPVGSWGTFGCFSFHPRKAITTGEGGLVTTSDPALAESVRLFRNHGMIPGGPSGYTFLEAGLNYRLTEFQAALGLVQLGRMGDIQEARHRLAQGYRQRLRQRCPSLGLAADPPQAAHTWQTLLVLLPEGKDRSRVQAVLKDKGIETSVGAHCLHRQPIYQADPMAFPGSLALGDRGLALPLHPALEESDLERVVDALVVALA